MNQKIGTLTADITTNTTGLTKGVKRTDKALKANEKRIAANAKQWDKWSVASTAATVALTAAVTIATRKIIQYADSFTSIQNQIRQTTSSTEELTTRTDQLLDVANRSRVSFSATADLYQQLTLSTDNLNLSTEEQLRLTETITKSFAVSGKSAAESAGAIRQLGQAFSAGALRGDEFNSIAEGAPEIMRALQRSLKLTQGELREFAATGGITAEILVEALGDAAEVIDIKMSQSIKTLSQSMQEAENNAISFVGKNELITDSMTLAGDAVVTLSENLDVLVDVALLGAAIGYAKLSSAIVLNTVETVKNTASKFASVPVTKTVNNGINFTTASVVRQTFAMKAARISAIGLQGAMAVLGGPVGVAILAATAIASFALSADDAKEPTDNLGKSVKDLTREFKELSQGKLDRQLANNSAQTVVLGKELDTLFDKAAKLRESVKSGRGGGLGFDDKKLEQVNARIKEINIEMESLAVTGAALFDASLGKTLTDLTSGDPEGDKKTDDENELKRQKANDAFARRFADLQDQFALEKEEKERQRLETIADFEKQTATQLELENILHAEDLERLRSNFKDRQNVTSEEQALEQSLLAQHEKTKTDIINAENEAKRQIFSRNADAVLGAIAAVGGKSLKLQKAISLASSAVAIATGIARAQELGFPANIAEIARVVAVGANVVRTIKGTSVGSGGSVSRPSSGGGGGSGAPAQAAPAPVADRNITIGVTGLSAGGQFSAEEIRQLIRQINEQTGDGVTLNVGG